MASNFGKFIKRQGKGKDDAARPKPAGAAPLLEGATRPVDMKDLAHAEAAIAAGEALSAGTGPAPAPKAPAAAEVANDEEVTAEVSAKAPKAPPSPAVVPMPRAAPRVVAPPPARRSPVALVPSAPVEAPAEATEEAAAPASAPAPSEKPKGDMAGLLEKLKSTVESLLAPVKEQIEGLAKKVEELGTQVAAMQETVSGNDETITQFGEGLDGIEQKLGTLRTDLDTLKGTVEQNDQTVTSLAEGLDELSGQLLGEKPEEALAAFGGQPVVPLLLEQVTETAGYMDAVVGTDGERIASFVNDNTTLTAKTFAIELLKKTPDEAKLHRAAVERGYETSRDVLSELAANEEYAIEVVGALYLAPAESLDDADKAQLKAGVVANAKAVSARADFYIKKLDWSAIEKEGKAVLSGGDE